jgi:hypothetical protein
MSQDLGNTTGSSCIKHPKTINLAWTQINGSPSANSCHFTTHGVPIIADWDKQPAGRSTVEMHQNPKSQYLAYSRHHGMAASWRADDDGMELMTIPVHLGTVAKNRSLGGSSKSPVSSPSGTGKLDITKETPDQHHNDSKQSHGRQGPWFTSEKFFNTQNARQPDFKRAPRAPPPLVRLVDH